MGHKNKGLTLIETVVVVAVLSVLSLSLYIVFKSGMDAWSRSDTRLEVFQNARVILGQISRELRGAFVGGDAVFAGADGGGSSPDEIEFATAIGNSIYQLKYWIDAGSTPNVFTREYEEDPDFGAGITWEEPIAFNEAGDDVRVSNIQFEYWDDEAGPAAWTGDGDWTDTGRLPAEVKIILTLEDSNTDTYQFETKVYLPNSE